MKNIKSWIRKHKEEIVNTYIVMVTAIAILLGIAAFSCSVIIEENNLQGYFYTSDLPAEEF